MDPNDFMAKFSSADRPPITPSSLGLTPRFNLTPSANVLSQILPAAGKPPLAPSVQNLMDLAGSSGSSLTNDSSLHNLLKGKENKNSGSQKSRKSDTDTWFDNNYGIEYKAKDLKGKENKNFSSQKSWKNRNKNKKQSRESQGMPSYLGFPKVDALDTPTNSRPTAGIDTLESSVEKPKDLCCKWSLDRNAENTVIDLIEDSPENPLKDDEKNDENLNTTDKITGVEIDSSNSADLQFEQKNTTGITGKMVKENDMENSDVIQANIEASQINKSYVTSSPLTKPEIAIDRPLAIAEKNCTNEEGAKNLSMNTDHLVEQNATVESDVIKSGIEHSINVENFEASQINKSNVTSSPLTKTEIAIDRPLAIAVINVINEEGAKILSMKTDHLVEQNTAVKSDVIKSGIEHSIDVASGEYDKVHGTSISDTMVASKTIDETIKEVCYTEAKIFRLPTFREKTSEDISFAPVDVCRGKNHLYVVSRSWDHSSVGTVVGTVAVFDDDRFKGLLKIEDRKLFNAPHNIVYIPPNGCKHILATGGLVILDDDGFHVFLEDGQYITTMFKGLGRQFRGLAIHHSDDTENNFIEESISKAYLVTVDISDSNVAYLCLINLEKVLSWALKDVNDSKMAIQDLIRIKMEPTEQKFGGMDQKIKCRFIATTSDKCAQVKKMCDQTFAPYNTSEEIVYISGLMSKQVYSVNLKTKKCKAMKLAQRAPAVASIDLTFAEAPPKNYEATFVSEPSFTTSPFALGKPAGLQVDDKGNLLIADNQRNEVCVFDSSGLLIKRVIQGKVPSELSRRCNGNYENMELCEPIGIAFDRLKQDLFVCSNKSKAVIQYKL